MGLNVLRMYAARRSGHHAVLHWIIRQIENRVVHLNNLNTMGLGTPLKVDESSIGAADPSYYRSIDPPEFYGEESKPVTHITCNFEDCAPGEFVKPPLKMPTPDDWPTIHVVVLRDPLNLIASRVRAFRIGKGDYFVTPEGIQNYIDWCYCLMRDESPVRPYCVLNYNAWFLSRAYRQKVAEALGLHFTDDGIDFVPFSGEGSSFDSRNFDGKAQEMKVLYRFEDMLEDQIFNNIVSTYREHFHAINESLFEGLTPYSLDGSGDVVHQRQIQAANPNEAPVEENKPAS